MRLMYQLCGDVNHTTPKHPLTKSVPLHELSGGEGPSPPTHPFPPSTWAKAKASLQQSVIENLSTGLYKLDEIKKFRHNRLLMAAAGQELHFGEPRAPEITSIRLCRYDL